MACRPTSGARSWRTGSTSFSSFAYIAATIWLLQKVERVEAARGRRRQSDKNQRSGAMHRECPSLAKLGDWRTTSIELLMLVMTTIFFLTWGASRSQAGTPSTTISVFTARRRSAGRSISEPGLLGEVVGTGNRNSGPSGRWSSSRIPAPTRLPESKPVGAAHSQTGCRSDGAETAAAVRALTAASGVFGGPRRGTRTTGTDRFRRLARIALSTYRSAA